MNEPPWDEAEVWTHASQRSEALLMFVKEYLLRGKCLFHLPCFHLLDEKTRPRGLRILRWTQHTKANTTGWTHFFPCYFLFSFLSVLDTKPRASHKLENFSYLWVTSKALEKQGFLFMDSCSGFRRCCSPIPHVCEVSGYLYHLHQRVQVLVNASLVKACLRQGIACVRACERVSLRVSVHVLEFVTA